MKNDLYDMGDDTVIVWVTDSGVPAGETLARYLAQLREDGVGTEDALICPNGYARGRENAELAKHFTWHSLRQGGATLAFNT
eukprot:83447-Rhodomonas_salina.2